MTSGLVRIQSLCLAYRGGRTPSIPAIRRRGHQHTIPCVFLRLLHVCLPAHLVSKGKSFTHRCFKFFCLQKVALKSKKCRPVCTVPQHKAPTQGCLARSYQNIIDCGRKPHSLKSKSWVLSSSSLPKYPELS